MLIVSLTTFSKRINTVYKTIESILKQDLSADKILLWLDELEFTKDTIPESLQLLERNSQLEIQYCRNTRSYKKLLPTLKSHPNDTVITIDDDIVYGGNFLSSLWNMHLLYPKDIIATRARLIGTHGDGLKPYGAWGMIRNSEPLISDFCFLPIGCYGILYPAGSLPSEVFSGFEQLAPTADDIWFKAMTLLSNRRTVLLPFETGGSQRVIEGTQDISLSRNDNFGDRNTEQFHKILEHFKEIKEKVQSTDFHYVSIDKNSVNGVCKPFIRFDSQEKALGLLRDSAKVLENIDSRKSLALYKLAKQVKPSAPLVNRGISRLEKLLVKQEQTKNKSGQKNIYTVIGCFRSGTNYLKTIIESNYNYEVRFNTYGWKHGLLPVLTGTEKKSMIKRGDLIISVTKNPFSFLYSMFKYCSKINKNVICDTSSFSNFIKSKFIIFDTDESSTQLYFSNPIAYWNSINWNHSSSPNVISVRYEDLLKVNEFEELEKIIPALKERINVKFYKPKNSVKRMNELTDYGNSGYESKNMFQSDLYCNKEYMTFFDEADFEFVLSKLDHQLLDRLGYETEIIR
jgi:hypothetical protein